MQIIVITCGSKLPGKKVSARRLNYSSALCGVDMNKDLTVSVSVILKILTFCSPLLDTACDHPQGARLHRCGQDRVQLLLLKANIQITIKTSEYIF